MFKEPQLLKIQTPIYAPVYVSIDFFISDTLKTNLHLTIFQLIRKSTLDLRRYSIFFNISAYLVSNSKYNQKFFLICRIVLHLFLSHKCICLNTNLLKILHFSMRTITWDEWICMNIFTLYIEKPFKIRFGAQKLYQSKNFTYFRWYD